jgi:signal transduction histidine kinase
MSSLRKVEVERKLETSEKQLAYLKQGYRSVLEFMDKMEQLAQFQDKIDFPPDIDQIWKVFLEDIRNSIALEACALFLVDETTLEFVLNGVSPRDKGTLCRQEIDFQIECGMFSWLINRREPAIVPSAVFKDNQTIIMLPLSTIKQTLGVVLVVTPIQESAITRENMKMLKLLAKQCSLVMENSLLYDRLMKEHESLQSAQARILQSEKLASMGQLTMGAFHEILNPLNIISGHIQFALMDTELNPRMSKNLAIMEEQSNRIADIVKGMLQFSQQADSCEEEIRVNDLIDKAVSFFKDDLESNGIEIVQELDDRLPVIMGEEDNLSQVVTHMIANARDAMPEGGVLRISTLADDGNARSSERPESIKIRFRDTGCGISKEHVNKIFDPFFTTKEAGKGTGLGLSLCYGIVNNHGGFIQVDSKRGKGATFTIHLPAPNVDAPRHATVSPNDLSGKVSRHP